MADEFDAIYEDNSDPSGSGVRVADAASSEDDVLNLAGVSALVPDPIVVRGAGNITV